MNKLKSCFECGYTDPDNSCEFCLGFNDGECKLDSIDFYTGDETICDYCKNQESNKCLICCNLESN